MLASRPCLSVFLASPAALSAAALLLMLLLPLLIDAEAVAAAGLVMSAASKLRKPHPATAAAQIAAVQ
jgi:hypothetical protein